MFERSSALEASFKSIMVSMVLLVLILFQCHAASDPRLVVVDSSTQSLLGGPMLGRYWSVGERANNAWWGSLRNREGRFRYLIACQV